jgi:catechol 2,3-dioxygenase-like lactoylglutathione lyase family enzyme
MLVEVKPVTPYAPPTRLLAVELLSATPLAKLKDFYHTSLGLRLLEDQPNRLTLAAGSSRLTFVPAPPDVGQPFYHFAFNIPENKIREARDWQRQRSPLLPIPKTLRDSNYPDDIVNYSHWNAHSVFFFDPAGNVVEHIARHDLKNASGGGFGPDDLLCLSEIAFVVDDVPAASAELQGVAGVSQYRGGNDQFVALGDEQGLLLVMKRGRMISFEAPERKNVTVFRTTATVRGPQPTRYRFPTFPYELKIEAPAAG